jgi:hypothetical protein
MPIRIVRNKKDKISKDNWRKKEIHYFPNNNKKIEVVRFLDGAENLHRIDGPAVIWHDGTEHYWIHGKYINKGKQKKQTKIIPTTQIEWIPYDSRFYSREPTFAYLASVKHNKTTIELRVRQIPLSKWIASIFFPDTSKEFSIEEKTLNKAKQRAELLIQALTSPLV